MTKQSQYEEDLEYCKDIILFRDSLLDEQLCSKLGISKRVIYAGYNYVYNDHVIASYASKCEITFSISTSNHISHLSNESGIYCTLLGTYDVLPEYTEEMHFQDSLLYEPQGVRNKLLLCTLHKKSVQDYISFRFYFTRVDGIVKRIKELKNDSI